jgi:hypothetical protein
VSCINVIVEVEFYISCATIVAALSCIELH